MTVKQAADDLAKRAAAKRATLEKAAEGFLGSALPGVTGKLTGYLGGAASKLNLGAASDKVRTAWGGLSPWQQSGVQGAALGGLGGLALGSLHDDEDGERHPWSTALQGAVAGGALGAGGHAAYSAFKRLGQEPTVQAPGKPAVPASVPEEGRRLRASRDNRAAQWERAGTSAAGDALAVGNALHHPLDTAKNLLSHPVDTGKSLFNGVKYSLPFAPHLHDQLRQGAVSPSNYGKITDPNVLRAALNPTNDTMRNQFGITAETARSLHGASDATLEAVAHGMRSNGVVPPELLARVPATERGLLANIVDPHASAQPKPSLLDFARKAFGGKSATPPAPVPPVAGFAPMTTPTPMLGDAGTPHNYGDLVGHGMESLTREGVTPRGSALKPFGTQSSVNFEEPRFSPKRLLGNRLGGAAAWGAPLLWAAKMYKNDNGGLPRADADRLKAIEQLGY